MEEEIIKVLIIEDDEEDYLLAKHYLANIPITKFQVDWEKDYLPAVKRVQQQNHDVYILDYNIKGDSGVDLVKYINKQGLNLPFIFLTGIDNYKMDMDAMNAGATDYLIKGQINAEILERSIRYAIKQKQTENQLIESNNTKTKLFSIISHDLQSPFNNLIGALDLISDNSDVDLSIFFKIIDKIKKDFNPTYDLMQNLLYWSRSQLGSINCDLKDAVLFDHIENVEQQLQPLIDQKKINYTNHVDKKLMALIDPQMFELIVRNILTNAIKFTPSKGRIDIKAIANSDQIQISISDTGLGMDCDTFNNLFRKDLFISTNGTNNERGSGLGIKLCSEFIEKCKGKFWAESQLGKGSTFYFTIPTKN